MYVCSLCVCVCVCVRVYVCIYVCSLCVCVCVRDKHWRYVTFVFEVIDTQDPDLVTLLLKVAIMML